jgi:hypothetical protein
MSSFPVQQALFRCSADQPHALRARSAGFIDEWRIEAERIIVGFGQRDRTMPCPLAVFALPVTARHVAVVRVTAAAGGQLAFHFLVMDRTSYERYAGDPFAVARRLPAVWDAEGEVPPFSWPTTPLPPRTVDDVQSVLRRVKASALEEDEDPEAPTFERTADNSESPALLGGSQILVDGGKLVFTRPRGDLGLVEALWTLLPNSTRCKLWPASFAFTNELSFDVVVLPRLVDEGLEGYTTEDQAAEYPAGSYELALQTAAESGDQAALDAVFQRRNSSEMIRLALLLLAGMLLLVVGSRWFVPPAGQAGLTLPQQKAAAAAGIIAAGEPWTAAGMLEYGLRLWVKPE